ncbi:hypothetical protein JL721_10968 [Aureococcus anophagefferens]|nr:hypothetical protein JL721_10968 [Aureococcus anophagefferens]
MTDAPPLLTWRRGGGAALLEEIDALVANHCDAHACALRSFGDSSDKAHRAWYLQREAVASGFADRLWACCAACDAWGVTARGGEALRRRGRPGLRCLEILRYDAGGGALGLHDDGETLLTTSLMVSPAGAFDGGAVEVARWPGRLEGRSAGDAAAWRWEKHRVAPVTRGARVVVVAEWWAGPDAPRADRRARRSRGSRRRPTRRRALAAVAHLRAAAGDAEGALALYDASLAGDPTCGAASRLRAKARLCGREADLAALAHAGAADPDVHAQLGALQARRGAVDEAAESFRLAAVARGGSGDVT